MFISCLRAQYITRSVTILSHAEIFLNFLACSVAGRYNELELPDKHKHEGKRVKTMPFRIIRNDITKVEADAIVNTANPEPVVGGGTDFSVHEAAGPELLEARKKIGPIPVGTSVETPAFRLPARYVLHTVSPVWIDGEHGEEDLLRKAYDSALALADRLGCRSVAFPLMAAGTYAFPHDIALATAIRAFTDFLMDHEMQIDLVLFNAKAFGLAESLFDDLKSYIDDNYVEERQKTEYRIDNDHISNRSERAYEDALLYRRRRRRKGTEQAENSSTGLPHTLSRMKRLPAAFPWQMPHQLLRRSAAHLTTFSGTATRRFLNICWIFSENGMVRIPRYINGRKSASSFSAKS